MVKQGNLLSKTLVIGIIILFIGMSVVSSTRNINADIPSNIKIKKVVDSSEEILFRGKTAYGYIAYSGSSGHPEGPCYFALDNPGEITSLGPTESGHFLTGGTWVCGDRWIGIEYNDLPYFWEIDPVTGDMWWIGYGGTGFDSLSYNPVNEKLYVCCGGVALYEIDMTSGETDLICHFTGAPNSIVGIAFDRCGILYGWDDDNLWIIDIENCEGTLVGPHGIGVYYGGYGHFDYDTDILYISTYYSQGNLYECDEDTGECTLVGNFEGGAEITALAIPYNCSNHPPDPAHDPVPPDGACYVPGDAILCWNGSDPDSGDSLTYDVYFSINFPPILVSYNQSESYYDPYGTNDMEIFQDYFWKIVTRDRNGEETLGPNWTFNTDLGIPLTKPEINGPNRGIPGIVYNFTFVSTHPYNISIKYNVDWGDGNTIESDYHSSGEVVTLNHTWNARKTYSIKAIAENIYCQQSGESTFKINIPRNKAVNFNLNLLNWFLERFPLLGVFLRAMNLLR